MIRNILARRMRAAVSDYSFAVSMAGPLTAEIMGLRAKADRAINRYEWWADLTQKKF